MSALSSTLSNTAINLSALHFSWGKRATWTLNIPELLIHTGERVFLYGPSGSGKTTLLDLITGIHVPQQGNVEILGNRIDALSSKQRDRFRADHCGIIFQQFNLLPYLNVLENVLLPCRFSRNRKERAGEQLEETASELLLALGLTPDLHRRRTTTLSVGQQQRVAVVRALIGRPELIIADEPTSALDRDNRDDFIQTLMREARTAGTTILFVSHDRDLATHFDRSISLPDISVAANGGEA